MAEGKDVVAFLGPITSYTHQATLDRFPESKYNLSPQTTIEDVFGAVQSGSVSRGVVPFENSSNGSVIFTLDLFADLHGRNPDILVCGEIYLPVHHCLLGHTDEQRSGNEGSQHQDSQGRPLHDLKHITKLYSHHQAWGQCNNFLATHLKGVERIDVSSTSKAAEIVSQDASGSSAAISSRMAGEVHSLDLLAENIEDREGNSTRFFVLQRRKGADAPPATEGQAVDGTTETEHARHKTLVSFT
ncbi:prephenate dehydratase, partial [Teratosphaeriaceae sp. CCFEE 6253]